MGRRGQKVIVAALATAFIGAIAAAAWWQRPSKQLPPPPPRVVLGTQRLKLKGDAVGNALDAVRRYARSALRIEFPGGKTYTLHAPLLGLQIDRLRLAALVKNVQEPSSLLRRAYAERRANDPEATLRLPLPVAMVGDAGLKALLRLKDSVDRNAKDAVVNLETRQLEPDKPGLRVDVYATWSRLALALQRGESRLKAAVETIRPRVSAKQLGNVRFDSVLGYFSTRYSRSARSRARTFNLRQAASRLDGTVLLPGERFDFNTTVGPRDEAHGYRVAPVIAEGELVDGIGGGTCQISGTLHGAAFFAGLDILEKTPHTRPSSYIKLGLDAAVAFPTINFKMRNNFPFPVVLHQQVKGGWVTAEILGPKRRRTTSFFRRIDAVIPFAEQVRQSDELPEGDRVLRQRGIPGFRATVIRVVRDGAYAWRTKSQNRYPPTTQIVLEGSGNGSEKKKLKQDRSLEYKADEYLVLTQGPGIAANNGRNPQQGGGTSESRTPGRYGKEGWQAKLGMQVFSEDEEEDDKE